MKFNKIFPFLILPLLILFSTTSCKKDKVYYQDYAKFDEGYWPRFRHLTFDVPIDNTKIKYDILFDVTYDKKIDYSVLPIQVNTTTPDGEERYSEFHLKLKDKEGKLQGVQQNDSTLTFTHVIRHSISLSQPGKLHVDIECFYPKYYIEHISKAGVRLVKATETEKNKQKAIEEKRKELNNDQHN